MHAIDTQDVRSGANDCAFVGADGSLRTSHTAAAPD